MAAMYASSARQNVTNGGTSGCPDRSSCCSLCIWALSVIQASPIVGVSTQSARAVVAAAHPASSRLKQLSTIEAGTSRGCHGPTRDGCQPPWRSHERTVVLRKSGDCSSDCLQALRRFSSRTRAPSRSRFSRRPPENRTGREPASTTRRVEYRRALSAAVRTIRDRCRAATGHRLSPTL